MARKIEYPLSSIDKGIELILQNCQSMLDEAQVLLKNHEIKYSFILFTFALEEYGKAVLLRQRKTERADDKNSIIRDDKITDHNAKLAAAGSVLGPRAMVPDWQFPESHFGEPIVFGPPETLGPLADFETRISLLYVDYYDDGWRIGSKEPHYYSLEESMEVLSEGIKNFHRG